VYAQTLVQLAARMRQHQYADGDVARMAAAHEVATRLFSGWHRPSGDPLLAHLVGTASILVELRRPVDTVVAGLLHAAYPNGDFGVVPGGATPRNRARVRRAIGETSERYVHDFAAIDREVVTIRLANVLDDCLDRPYVTGQAARYDASMLSVWPLVVEMAEALGYGGLAAELRARRDGAELPALPGRDGVFNVAPASYRLRWGIALRRVATAAIARLRDALRPLRPSTSTR
jgi:HD domain